ncbi:MAG: efflux RND transporter periplasmic adaptor subunit [Methylococcaceae bacterium]|nr:efflux RND transporter periplasmic adaptor subunit [Methylococcaceae bacterium]
MKKILLPLILLAYANTVIANDYEIKITKVQLYNLGVKTGKLKTINHIPLLYAPAKVVIPPSQEYIVSAAQAGLISKLNVTIGDSVEKNQVLAHINSPELLSLQRQLLKANGEKQLARASFQRNEKLLQEGVISDRRWQESRSRYNSFAAEANEAKQLLEIAGMSAKDIKKLADSHRLSSQLNIRSPIKGVVLDRMVVAGERLDILAPLYRIANLEQLWLEINIPQERMSSIKIGDKVLIENTDITATISLLGQSVNTQNQTILARAVINDQQSTLRAGQNVNSQIIQGSDKPTYIVPNTAIAQNEGKAYLFIQSSTGFVVSPIAVIGKQQNNSVITGNNDLIEGIEIAIQGAVALKANWLGLGGSE